MLKKTLISAVISTLTAVVVAPALAADVPGNIVYRGYLTDKAGAAVTKDVNVKVGLYQSLAGADLVGTVIDLGTTHVTGGYFTLEISDFKGEFGGYANLYLEITVDSKTLTPRAHIGTVPYSYVSSDVVGDIHPASITVGSSLVVDATGKWQGDTTNFPGVRSVTASAPLSGGTITNTGSVGISKADASTDGYLAKEDFTAFAAKQNLVTGTCSAGSAIRVVNPNGTVTCEFDDNTGGTVTSVDTGLGLAGGPISTNGTISLAASYLDGSIYDTRFVNEGQTNSISSTMLQDTSVTGGKLAAAYQDGSAFDSRFVNTSGDTMTGVLGVPGDGFTVGTDQLVCKSGNVGVGTSSPIAGLHVANGGEMAGTGAISSTGTTVTGAGTSFTIELHVGDIIVAQGQKQNIATITSDLELTTNPGFSPALPATAFTYQQSTAMLTDNGGATQMVVNGLGNVGIGTAAPIKKLHVMDGEIFVTNTLPGENAVIRLSENLSLSGATYGLMYWDPINKSLGFGHGGGFGESVAIKNGNVGVGTTNPVAPLHIDRSDVELMRFTKSGTGASTYTVEIHSQMSGDNSDLGIKPQTFNTGTVLYARNGFGTLVPGVGVDRSGNVSIGHGSPGANLDVKAGGTTLADAWTPRSSRRFKENIRPIERATEKLSKLQGVYFDWRDTKKKSLGLIAEDTGKVFPELVNYEDNGQDAKSLDYDKLSAVLIEAVKEQQQQIEQLKAQNERLEKKMEAVIAATGGDGRAEDGRTSLRSGRPYDRPCTAPASTTTFVASALVLALAVGLVLVGRKRS